MRLKLMLKKIKDQQKLNRQFYRIYNEISIISMRIPILVSINLGQDIPEWAIIELQGQIIARKGSFEDETIGPLSIENDLATLIIGNHKLNGKVHKLKKPLAVVHRGTTEGLPIIAVIRHKVVFPDRPQILFSNV